MYQLERLVVVHKEVSNQRRFPKPVLTMNQNEFGGGDCCRGFITILGILLFVVVVVVVVVADRQIDGTRKQ